MSTDVHVSIFVLQGLLEGSQEYVSLEQAAREYFQSHSIQSQPSTGQLILDLLNTLDLDIDEMKKGEAGLPPSDGNVSCLLSGSVFPENRISVKLCHLP